MEDQKNFLVEARKAIKKLQNENDKLRQQLQLAQSSQSKEAQSPHPKAMQLLQENEKLKRIIANMEDENTMRKQNEEQLSAKIQSLMREKKLLEESSPKKAQPNRRDIESQQRLEKEIARLNETLGDKDVQISALTAETQLLQQRYEEAIEKLDVIFIFYILHFL
jgi:hypothetical protein